jgi:hypothetical protein
VDLVDHKLTPRLILVLRTYRSGRWIHVRQSPVGVSGQSLGTDQTSDRSHSRRYGPWTLVIPNELSVGVVRRGGPDEVVASYRRVLVPGAVLDWSTRSEPAGDLGSLDPSEAPEWLHDLFNHEGAISRCAVPLPGVRSRIVLSKSQEGTSCDGFPFVTVSQSGLPLSVCVMKALQRVQLFALGAESRGLPKVERVFSRRQMDCSPSLPAKVSLGEGMQEGDLRGRYSS